MSADIEKLDVLTVMRSKYDHMSTSERKVMNVIFKDPVEAVQYNVSEIANVANVSDATVIRMCQHLGYKGYYQFRIELAKRLDTEDDDESPESDNPIQSILNRYAENIVKIGEMLDITEVRKCIQLINNSTYVHLIAVGNTVPLTEYMSFRLGRLGYRCTSERNAVYFISQINLAPATDVIFAISRSGSSKEVIQAVDLGRQRGLKVIALTSSKLSPLSERADALLLSNSLGKTYNYYKEYARLNETAVIDCVLDLLTDHKKIKEKDASKPEEILASNKL